MSGKAKAAISLSEYWDGEPKQKSVPLRGSELGTTLARPGIFQFLRGSAGIEEES